jgi:predicted enzyme related to lactoylglutathione lyase
LAFYSAVLGMPPSRVYPQNRGGEFDLPDGSTFGLWGAGNSNFPFQPSNGVLFAVDDVEAAAGALRERGTEFRDLDLPNCRMLSFADTEGNSVFLHKRKA